MLYKSLKLTDFIKDLIVDHNDLYGNTDLMVKELADTKQAAFVKYLIDQDENMEFMSALYASDFSCLLGNLSTDMKIAFSNKVIYTLIEYFSNDMQEMIDDLKEEVSGEIRMDFLEENAMRSITDTNTGEVRWYR